MKLKSFILVHLLAEIATCQEFNKSLSIKLLMRLEKRRKKSSESVVQFVCSFQFLKITSLFCKSSKLLTTYLNCTLVHVSKTHSYIDAKISLKKPIFNWKLDVDLFFRKSSGNEFKRIIQWSQIDMCKFAENINSSYSVIKDHLMYINNKLNNVLHRCPYMQLEVHNVSFSLEGNENLNAFIFSNGEIKCNVKFYNNREKNLLLTEVVVLQHFVKNKT